VLPLAKECGKPYVIKELIMGEILAIKHLSKRENQKISLLISQLQRLFGTMQENFEHENASHTSSTVRECTMMNPSQQQH